MAKTTRDELIARFKKEWGESHTKKQRIQLLKKMLKEAEQANYKECHLLFDGLLAWTESKHEEAIPLLKQAVEAAPELPYTWNGLGNVYNDLKQYDKAINAFNKAKEIDQSIAYPWNGLGNSYKELRQYSKAIKAYKKAIEIDKSLAHPWSGLGNTYCEINEYDNAIRAYKKRLEFEEISPIPWNGLGNAYRAKKQYSKAIEAYKKAIELDDSFAYPWNGLGNAYEDIKEYSNAIEAFKHALEIDKSLASPWNGLGIVYKKLNQYDKAIEAYQKAIELDSNYNLPYYNLGLLYYYDLGEFENARQSFQMALNKIDPELDEYWYKQTKTALQRAENEIKSLEALKTTPSTDDDTTALVLKATTEEDEKGHSMEGIVRENKKNFKEFLEEPGGDTKGVSDAEFKVLRRWNSYTPIVADNFHVSKGGGYFLKVKDGDKYKGIVIDPGFNFIDNFRGDDHFFHEIDAVFISHAHNDHTADLESILTLLHKYNKEIIGDKEEPEPGTTRYKLSEKRKKPSEKLSDKEVKEDFENSGRGKTIDLYMTLSTFKKYSGMFDLMEGVAYKIHIMESGDKTDVHGVTVKALPAKHHDLISNRDSVGFAFKVENSVVVYTGDTGWSPEIEAAYTEFKSSSFFDKVKRTLLVAHLGGFDPKERHYLIEKKRKESYYKYHLGRLGVAKINEVLTPDVCFISEFGEELKGHRIPLAEIYTDAFKKKGFKTKFFPADIGLTMDLHTQKLEAVTAIFPDAKEPEKSYSKDFIPYKNVHYRLLRSDYSIHYFIKDKAKVDECDLMTILAEKYHKSKK